MTKAGELAPHVMVSNESDSKEYINWVKEEQNYSQLILKAKITSIDLDTSIKYFKLKVEELFPPSQSFLSQFQQSIQIVQLPKLQSSRFNEAIRHWSSFRDSFLSSIDSYNLQPVDKLKYSMSFLDRKAKQLPNRQAIL